MLLKTVSQMIAETIKGAHPWGKFLTIDDDGEIKVSVIFYVRRS